MIRANFVLLLRSTSTPSHHRNPLSPFTISYSLSSSASNNLPRSAMETSSKDTEQTKKDQQKEIHYKRARDIDPSKKVSDDILPHILNLYGSCASPQDFEIYAPDASFEDPLMCAQGVNEIKSAFYSLSKIFSESRIVEYSIKENILPHGRREINIDNKQYYKFRGKDIDMISLIKLYVEDGKVIRHEDLWNKKPLWNRESFSVPLFGQFIEVCRRASMFATHVMMNFGKDPTT